MERQRSDDSFYDGIDGSSQEYVSGLNQQSQPLNADNQAAQEEWKQELSKLEDEIQTLRSVLSVKIRQANELKKKLGITPIVEFKQDIRTGFQTIKESDVVQKTNETFHNWSESVANSQAVQKTNTALKSFGAFASKKLGDIRNSNAMKSMEGKLSDAYSSVKTKMGASTSSNNISEGAEGDNSNIPEGDKPPM